MPCPPARPLCAAQGCVLGPRGTATRAHSLTGPRPPPLPQKLVKILVDEHKLDPNAADYAGDTPLHDAARFGHAQAQPLCRRPIDNA